MYTLFDFCVEIIKNILSGKCKLTTTETEYKWYNLMKFNCELTEKNIEIYFFMDAGEEDEKNIEKLKQILKKAILCYKKTSS